MSSRDKTGDRLVASIRKTKAGAATAGEAPKTAPRRRRATSRAPSEAKKTTPKPSVNANANDSYRSVGRVWPD